MINYPNGKIFKKPLNKLNQKSNLGASLEDDLNQTNKYYRENNQALIHKKPTPIQVVRVDYPARSKAKITEAYYKLPSTTDYNGVYRGYAIDFEAKSTRNKTRMPLKMVHNHQINHLRQVVQHGGLAFLIIRFTIYDETYLLEFQTFDKYINKGNVKSLSYDWIKENAYLCQSSFQKPCDYLPGIELSLQKKEL